MSWFGRRFDILFMFIFLTPVRFFAGVSLKPFLAALLVLAQLVEASASSGSDPKSEVNSISCPSVIAPPSTHLQRTQSVLLWWATLAGSLAPYAALAGGFSGSGGGEGVALFPTKADADRARLLIAQGEALPNELLDRAKIQVLENWEMGKQEQLPFEVTAGMKWPEVLNIAKENLRVVSPIFFRRLNQTADWMQFSSWESAPHIPPLNDANLVAPLPENAVRIQVAVRLSSGNNSYGDGPTLNPLRLKVIFNKAVFDRMSPLDQAMLIFHEEVYAMAQGVGYLTSDAIRPLVKTYFSENFVRWKQQSENGVLMSPILHFFQTELIQRLGDYVVFFSKMPELGHSIPRSAARHFAIFLKLVLKARDLNECYSRESVCPTQVMKQVMNEMIFNTPLTEEEAFVFFSYFYLQRTLGVLNSESIMDTRRTSTEFAQAMSVTCQLLKTHSQKLILTSAVQQALRYCD